MLALDVHENFFKGRSQSQAVAGGGLPLSQTTQNRDLLGAGRRDLPTSFKKKYGNNVDIDVTHAL